MYSNQSVTKLFVYVALSNHVIFYALNHFSNLFVAGVFRHMHPCLTFTPSPITAVLLVDINIAYAHDEKTAMLQVETAVVEPLKDAMTEEQWRQYNTDIAAKAEAEKQAQEAAEQQRQAAEAQAAAELAAQQAEAERQSKLTKAWPLRLLLHLISTWSCTPIYLCTPHQSANTAAYMQPDGSHSCYTALHGTCSEALKSFAQCAQLVFNTVCFSLLR